MLFTSLNYYLFLVLLVPLFYLISSGYRWILLLLASYFFYMYWNWNPAYVSLLIFSSLIDYSISKKIYSVSDRANRKNWLILSVVLNLSLLFVFKYFNFFSTQINTFFQLFNPDSEAVFSRLILPLGISFYTFQTMSYTIDVYRGYYKPEKHLGKYLLYVSFFPQLVAGPIERAGQLLRQFHFGNKFEYSNMTAGLRLILWGLLKKLVIADKLALYVDKVYANGESYYGATIYMASVFFLFQIYCDFSGYTDIARGSARLFGINLSLNFKNRVYLITSFTKFWRGWHITLTNWFRDYVFFSLSGLKKGVFWMALATFITFVLNGFWHGANWTFIVWGALNGIFVVLEYLFTKPVHSWFNRIGIKVGSRWHQMISFLFCFHVAVISIVFFRADSLSRAWTMVKNILYVDQTQIGQSIWGIIPIFDFVIIILLIGLMDFFHQKFRDLGVDEYLGLKSQTFRWVFYVVILMMILYLGEPPKRAFIYFEF